MPNISALLWEQINAGNVSLDSIAVDESMINGICSVFTVNFSSYESMKTSLSANGTEEISGYTCNKYTMKTGHFGGHTENEYWIEPETGLCMKMIQRYKSFFFSNERTVLCDVFKTADLSLPEYKLKR